MFVMMMAVCTLLLSTVGRLVHCMCHDEGGRCIVCAMLRQVSRLCHD